MIHLSPKATLVYSFGLVAIVFLLIASLLFYFLYYNLKKVESVANKQVKSNVMEISDELLNLNSNNMKGGEEI